MDSNSVLNEVKIHRHEIVTSYNTNLLHNNKVYAKVIHYDEKSILKTMNNHDIDLIMDQLDVMIRNDIDHFKRLERIARLNSNTMKLFFDIHEILYHFNLRDDIKQKMKQMDLTMTQAYQLVHKINLNLKINEYNKKHQALSQDEKKLRYDFVQKINKLLVNHIFRLLFDYMSKNINTDFILYTETLYSSLFYDLHPHLQAIVTKSLSETPWYTHYAIYYQLPIISFQKPLNQENEILIDLVENVIDFHPDQTIAKRDSTTRKSIYIKYDADHKILESGINLYGMFANYRDVEYTNTLFFLKGIVFLTDYSIFSKGTSLTTREWEERFHHIFEVYKGKSITIRLPLMDKILRTSDFEDISTMDMLYCNPTYYENIIYAAAKVHQKFPDKQLSFMVPNIESRYDYENWIFHTREMYRDIEKNLPISFISGLENKWAIHEQTGMLSIEKQCIHLDAACNDYISGFSFGRTITDIKTLRNEGLYSDLMYNKEQFVVGKYRSINMLMGHYMTTYDVFHRLLVGGIKHFIIPLHIPEHILDQIEIRMATRGKFAGVFCEARLKTIQYRLVKAKHNLDIANTRRTLYTRQLHETYVESFDIEDVVDPVIKQEIIKLLAIKKENSKKEEE